MESPEVIFLERKINYIKSSGSYEYNAFDYEDKGTSSNDLWKDSIIDTKDFKADEILISWNFLQKISDIYQWPLLCISNLIDNSVIHGQASKINLDVCCIKKSYLNKDESIKLEVLNNIKVEQGIDCNLVFSIKDNGKGISGERFSKIFFTFGCYSYCKGSSKSKPICSCQSKAKKLNIIKNDSIEEKVFKDLFEEKTKNLSEKEKIKLFLEKNCKEKEKYFGDYHFGNTLKGSALRLAYSFLIITKTKTELSIGLISHNMQSKASMDLILTPVVFYDINQNIKNKYTPKGYLPEVFLGMIINEVRFLFKSKEELFKYCNEFDTGTHIFLYDLKQIFPLEDIDKKYLKCFELLFDLNAKDIFYNSFQIQTGLKTPIDVSLRNYLRKYYLRRNHQFEIFLFEDKINLKDPIVEFYENYKNVLAIIPKMNDYLNVANSSFHISPKEETKIIVLEGFYNGILIKRNDLILNQLLSELNIFKESENGILLYLDGKLIKRCDQGILGETSFFYKKHFKRENKPSIGWFGFIELPKSLFEIIGNKAEFKDMSMFSYFYGKLHGMLKKAIPKNN